MFNVSQTDREYVSCEEQRNADGEAFDVNSLMETWVHAALNENALAQGIRDLANPRRTLCLLLRTFACANKGSIPIDAECWRCHQAGAASGWWRLSEPTSCNELLHLQLGDHKLEQLREIVAPAKPSNSA